MVNDSRSQNAELAMGLSDGTVKKMTPDRGGVVSSAPYEAAVKGMLNEQYRAVACDHCADTTAQRHTFL